VALDVGDPVGQVPVFGEVASALGGTVPAARHSSTSSATASPRSIAPSQGGPLPNTVRPWPVAGVVVYAR